MPSWACSFPVPVKIRVTRGHYDVQPPEGAEAIRLRPGQGHYHKKLATSSALVIEGRFVTQRKHQILPGMQIFFWPILAHFSIRSLEERYIGKFALG